MATTAPDQSLTASAPGEGGDWEEEARLRLEALERRVAAQYAALRQVPVSMPVPADVLALLGTAPDELGAHPLPARYLPRAALLCEQVQEMLDELNRRRWELGIAEVSWMGDLAAG